MVEDQEHRSWRLAGLEPPWCVSTQPRSGEFCLFPVFIPVVAVSWGPGQWQPGASSAHGSARSGVGSTSLSGEQETSSGLGAGRAETLQQAEKGFSAAEKAGKGARENHWKLPGKSLLGVEQGQAALGPESEQPSRRSWAEELTYSCKGAEEPMCLVRGLSPPGEGGPSPAAAGSLAEGGQ